MKQAVAAIICLLSLFGFSGCSTTGGVPSARAPAATILQQNNSMDAEQIRQFQEDVAYFASELPKRHKNPFTKTTKEEFEEKIAALMEDVDHLNKAEASARLCEIVASIGDAHTSVSIWDGRIYPLTFYLFGKDMYIVNSQKGMENVLYAKVIAVNGMPINKALLRMRSVVSYENESWLNYKLANILSLPIYLYGLGIVPDEASATFTLEKDGVRQDVTVSAQPTRGTQKDFCVETYDDIVLGHFSRDYAYEYLPDQKAVYFTYNKCYSSGAFRLFNKRMFEDIADKNVERIILDLRRNTGGDSEVLNPFTEKLKAYREAHPNVQVFILTGRLTFSSSIFAIYRTMEAVPDAMSIGEPTGVALDHFGQVKSFQLPNSQIPIYYSTEYYEFSRVYSYRNKRTDTFIPDVLLPPTIEDYRVGNDAALNYALGY